MCKTSSVFTTNLKTREPLFTFQNTAILAWKLSKNFRKGGKWNGNFMGSFRKTRKLLNFHKATKHSGRKITLRKFPVRNTSRGYFFNFWKLLPVPLAKRNLISGNLNRNFLSIGKRPLVFHMLYFTGMLLGDLRGYFAQSHVVNYYVRLGA